MKADISKKSISIRYLNEAIDKFIACKNAKREDMYIIMNYETELELRKEFSFFRLIEDNKIRTYEGIRIAIDNGLAFGEIDIR